MISKRYKVEQSGTFSEDSESDWSLTEDWQRIVSLFIAIAYVVVWPIVIPPKSLSQLMGGSLIRIVSLAFPLACIWFGDDMGEYYSYGSRITGPSRGRFVRCGGWMLLLLPVLIVLIVWLLDSLYAQ
jgi:hypothetical protein